MADRAHHIMGGKSSKKKSGKHAHQVHIRRGATGGFIAVNHQEPDADDQGGGTTEHPIMDMNQLKAHLDSSMGDQPAAPAAAPPVDPAVAAAASASPAAAPMPPQQ